MIKITLSPNTVMATISSEPDITIWQSSWTTTPPSSCSQLEWIDYNSAFQSGYWGQCNGAADPACYPWGSTSTFSPVTACPSGWASFTTASTPSSILPEETILICCPDGYAFRMVGNSPYEQCAATRTGGFDVRTDCGQTSVLFTSIGTESLDMVRANHLEMRYRAEDVKGPKGVPATTTAAGGSLPSDAPDSSSLTGSRSNKKGFSSAAKAGIGVGVPLVIVAIALALRYLHRRRKKAKHSTAMPAQDVPHEEHGKPELMGSDVYAATGMHQGGNTHGYVEKSELPVHDGAFVGETSAASRSDRFSATHAELDSIPNVVPSVPRFGSISVKPPHPVVPTELPNNQKPQELPNEGRTQSSAQ